MVCSERIVKFLQRIVTLLSIALLCVGCASRLPTLSQNPWEVVPLSTDANLIDLAFTGNLDHGWIVGNNSTLLETQDGGQHWQVQQLDLGEQKYLLTSVSFAGDDGWIAGKPSLLLHTTDGGKSWSRIALSAKLPGDPGQMTALGPNSAEMVTDLGAIYQTNDGGKTWQALVQEAFGVARNISRSEDGKYIAVSAKGNFYSSWEPGQTAWQPHNRNSSRRLEKIGFGKDGRLWMLARGGQIQFSDPEDPEVWGDSQLPELAASWGLLDLAYRTPEEIWVGGGSANLLCSFDGGETWQKDEAVQNVPANFYRVKFINPDTGFILGQNGALLRYQG